MNIAASSICWAHDSLEDAVRKAADAGFRAFEALTFPAEIFRLHGDLREMKAADLAAVMKRYNMKLAGLHLGAIMTPTEAKRRALTDYAKRAIEAAHETGCGIIVEGGPDRASEPVDPFMRSLEELVPLLEQANVRMALENHYLNWIQYIQDYEWIFDRITSPHVGMTLDSGHFTSAGVDPEAVARRFPGRVYHVHIKDHIGTQSVALGEGETNNMGMVRALKEAAFDGYLSQELEVADRENADRHAAEGLAYMRRLAAVGG